MVLYSCFYPQSVSTKASILAFYRSLQFYRFSEAQRLAHIPQLWSGRPQDKGQFVEARSFSSLTQPSH